MKLFSERNSVVIGVIGVVATVLAMVAAVQYDKVSVLASARSYQAYFEEVGGLRSGAAVQVSGLKVGEVSRIELDGPKVLIAFDIDRDITLGDSTEAKIKTRSVLGTQIVEVIPRGTVELDGPIPVERTTPPYQLPDALGELASTISGLDTTKVSESLRVVAETFQDTPINLQQALEGVARFSQTLNKRDAALRELLADASAVTHVLADHSAQIAGLIVHTNSLLVELRSESVALDEISGNISAVARQVSGLIADNRAQLRPALDKLNGVLSILDNRRGRIQESLKLLNAYGMSLGEALSGGPFFKAYVANLLPGQFIQPFVEAAFSDLGLDPNVLLPTERTDPHTGQPGTPALPIPYPRTGQGGEPHLTLPDAITGVPGDPRYPYRDPLPAPPPGGPPPGPPAVPEPGGPGQ